jgi:hypothetical protein
MLLRNNDMKLPHYLALQPSKEGAIFHSEWFINSKYIVYHCVTIAARRCCVFLWKPDTKLLHYAVSIPPKEQALCSGNLIKNYPTLRPQTPGKWRCVFLWKPDSKLPDYAASSSPFPEK